jgi:Zn-dependent protease with chaperone function
MTMTGEQFDALVKQLEDYAQRQPANYKLRLRLLALLGYAYIFLVIVGLLAVLALLVLIVIYSHRVNALLIKLGILILVPVFIILRSLWVHFPPPKGLELDRKKVPRLFDLINELTKALQSPSFHHVLLTSEFNAAVVQIPRLGLLGWQQNYLLIGLPLLQALSPQQFRAVLAHELGHLSGNHSRFAGWIYRVRKTWGQILERLHQSEHSAAAILMTRFLDWYAPYFQAYSFVLARADEYEADRCAAKLAGTQHTAEALLNIAVKSYVLEESFWTKVYKQADNQPDPPQSPYKALAKALTSQGEPENEKKWLEQALSVKTNNADTHPCLSDRLKAIGYSPKQLPSLPPKVKLSAAQQFLGTAAAQLTQELDTQWRTAVNYQWRERYTYAQKARQELKALEEKASSQSLTVEEAWNRAQWTMELRGNQEAIPLLRSVLAMQSDHVSANYLLGQILIEQEDVAGIEYLEKAMAKAPDIVLSGCQLMYSFLQKQGRESEAAQYRQRAEQHYDQLLLAEQERSGVSASDRFEPHGLPAEVETQFRQQLARYPQIKEAYLVRKVVQYFPEKPFYVLGIIRRRAFFEWEGEDQKLINRLVTELKFPGQAWILLLHGVNQPLVKVLRHMAIAPIYRR